MFELQSPSGTQGDSEQTFLTEVFVEDLSANFSSAKYPEHDEYEKNTIFVGRGIYCRLPLTQRQLTVLDLGMPLLIETKTINII